MIKKIMIQETPPYLKTELSDLKKLNFIYGPNGSGKTVLSRFMLNQTDCSNTTWENDKPLSMNVYNKDFVEKNFNQSEDIKGIFTLGESNVVLKQEIEEEQKKLEKINEEIKDYEGKQKTQKEILETIESEFSKKCWQKKLDYYKDFVEVFRGHMHSQEDFKKYCLPKPQESIVALEYDELKSKYATIFSSSLNSEDQIPFISGNEILSIEEESSILQESIVGKSDINIASLITKLNNSDWVKHGKVYFEKMNMHQCPFCQQKTPKDFAKNLVDYFDETFEKQINNIKDLYQKYRRFSDSLIKTVNATLDKPSDFFETDILSEKLKYFESIVSNNCKNFDQKIAEPSKCITLDSTKETLIAIDKIIKDANSNIKKYNETVANRKIEKINLKNQVLLFIQNKLIDDRQKYDRSLYTTKKSIDEQVNAIKDKEKQRKTLVKNINQLQSQITSILPTVEKINQSLKSCGINSFSIENIEDKNSYQLSRIDGSSAKETISEGEKTLITFLYFYHLLKGSKSPDTGTKDQIAVFDDPISSLDNNIFYFVSSLLNEIFSDIIIKDSKCIIKQCFVLTHNMHFYKAVTCRLLDRGKPNKNTSFWLIIKEDNGSKIQSCLHNPIASAYQLLWQDINRKNKSTIQNTIRRILEYYFNFIGNKDWVKSLKKLLDDKSERVIVESHIAWLHEGSHAPIEDLYSTHLTDQDIEKNLKVFRDIFEKTGHLDHYNMMMGIENNTTEH